MIDDAVTADSEEGTECAPVRDVSPERAKA
jgi:hypothetical protein